MKLDTANPPAVTSSTQELAAEGGPGTQSASSDSGFLLAATRRRLSLAVERWLLRKALAACGNPPIRVVLWDGEAITNTPDLPVGNVVIHDPATLRRLAFDPRVAFGDAYSEGTL